MVGHPTLTRCLFFGTAKSVNKCGHTGHVLSRISSLLRCGCPWCDKFQLNQVPQSLLMYPYKATNSVKCKTAQICVIVLIHYRRWRGLTRSGTVEPAGVDWLSGPKWDSVG